MAKNSVKYRLWCIEWTGTQANDKQAENGVFSLLMAYNKNQFYIVFRSEQTKKEPTFTS